MIDWAMSVAFESCFFFLPSSVRHNIFTISNIKSGTARRGRGHHAPILEVVEPKVLTPYFISDIIFCLSNDALKVEERNVCFSPSILNSMVLSCPSFSHLTSTHGVHQFYGCEDAHAFTTTRSLILMRKRVTNNSSKDLLNCRTCGKGDNNVMPPGRFSATRDHVLSRPELLFKGYVNEIELRSAH